MKSERVLVCIFVLLYAAGSVVWVSWSWEDYSGSCHSPPCRLPGSGDECQVRPFLSEHFSLADFHDGVCYTSFSDDRSADVFRQKLEATTQMQAVLTPDRRPTCLIIDEIDGAPTVRVCRV